MNIDSISKRNLALSEWLSDAPRKVHRAAQECRAGAGAERTSHDVHGVFMAGHMLREGERGQGGECQGQSACFLERTKCS